MANETDKILAKYNLVSKRKHDLLVEAVWDSLSYLVRELLDDDIPEANVRRIRTHVVDRLNQAVRQKDES